MPIGISEEHAELAASVRAWAESTTPREAVRAVEGKPAELGEWSARCAELGLASILMPEPHGGGGSVLDQAVALEAAAYSLVPGPLLGTTLAGALAEDDALRAGIADGSVRVGLALGGAAGDVVLDGPVATHVLVPASGGWAVVAADALALGEGESPDLGRGVSTLTEPVAAAGSIDDASLRRLLAVLVAAEASGIARWCLDTAVEYAGVREQFGRKIGAFQAIKHLCAQMLETSESVTAAAWDAAEAADGEAQEQAQFAAAVARTVCLDGAVSVAKSCIQVLGGIGFTFEHDAHLYLRRALLLRGLFGGGREWAAALADQAVSGVRRAVQVDLAGRDEAIRAEIRSLVADVAARPEAERRVALAETGLLTPHWPAPYGRGADPVEQLVIDDELARAGVERPDLKIGAWAAPTIVEHGDDAQRERFVGPTLRGELEWCQLFSEPEAGSDLASLRTKAVRVDGGWELTGQKVWTSLAHSADWGICLARTNPDAKPHAGITYFVLDMRAEGLDIRPLRELTGEAMFNEVFLDRVFVPDDCVIGEIDGGWRLARTTLANERVAMAGSRLGTSVERAVALVAEEPSARGEVGQAVALATVAKLLGVRATLRSLAGQGPGAESSVAKLVGVQSRQDSAELVVQLLGARVFAADERAREAMHELLLTRCLSIAGGTTQVLRNVAGERLLGLPRG